MKANEVKQDGYYWLSHDLNWYIPPGQQYPQRWNVVHVLEFEVNSIEGEMPLALTDVPVYADFIGPIEEPKGNQHG